MTRHSEPRSLRLLTPTRRSSASAADTLGFGYSRTDTDIEPLTPVVVPDGIELHFFTGRALREVTR